jgi:hypothetical protein
VEAHLPFPPAEGRERPQYEDRERRKQRKQKAVKAEKAEKAENGRIRNGSPFVLRFQPSPSSSTSDYGLLF